MVFSNILELMTFIYIPFSILRSDKCIRSTICVYDVTIYVPSFLLCTLWIYFIRPKDTSGLWIGYVFPLPSLLS